MICRSPSPDRHSSRLNRLLRTVAVPAQRVVPEGVARSGCRASRTPEIAAADRALNVVSSARSGASRSDACWIASGCGRVLPFRVRLPTSTRAAGRDLVVLLLVDVRHPRAHRRIGRDGAGELVDPLELDGAADVGQIDLALDP